MQTTLCRCPHTHQHIQARPTGCKLRIAGGASNQHEEDGDNDIKWIEGNRIHVRHEYRWTLFGFFMRYMYRYTYIEWFKKLCCINILGQSINNTPCIEHIYDYTCTWSVKGIPSDIFFLFSFEWNSSASLNGILSFKIVEIFELHVHKIHFQKNVTNAFQIPNGPARL